MLFAMAVSLKKKERRILIPRGSSPFKVQREWIRPGTMASDAYRISHRYYLLFANFAFYLIVTLALPPKSIVMQSWEHIFLDLCYPQTCPTLTLTFKRDHL